MKRGITHSKCLNLHVVIRKNAMYKCIMFRGIPIQNVRGVVDTNFLMKYSRSKGEITPLKIVVGYELIIVKCSLKSRTAY